MKHLKFKTRSTIALALALFMVVQVLFVALPGAKAAGNPIISVVPTGAAGATGTTMISGLSVGSTFVVDVRIDNIGGVSPGINGLSYSLTYNAAVLKISAYSLKQTSFWGDSAADVTAIPSNKTGIFTEVAIIVPSGAPDESANTPGVASKITFTVIGSGQSNINFQPSDTGIAYLSYPDSSGTSHDVVATPENAIYNLLTTQISLFQHGTPDSVIQFAPGTNPIGSTFTVDINMSNANQEPIWGWNLGVSWNPAVLQLLTVTEGTYLNPSPGLYDGSQTLFVVGHIDNNAGTIQQGISDIYLANTTTATLFGNMANLTFEVINYANSSITLTSGVPTLIDNHGVSQTVALNGAQYVTLPVPAARAPVAVIHNDGISTSYAPNQYFQLDAFQSLPGFDVIPSPTTPNLPITTYTWNFGTAAVTGVTYSSNGAQVAFYAPASVNGNLTVTLTVTTAANPADPTYVNTGSVTYNITPGVIPPTGAGAQIDVYVINNATTTAFPYKSPTSLGSFNTLDQVDNYAPQQIMNLGAYVTFNGAPVANELVTFVVSDNTTGIVIATFVAYTDANGTAYAVYRLPNFNSAVMLFGNYRVTVTVDVAQNVVSDAFSYQYGYTLSVSSLTVTPNIVARGRDTATLTVAINSISFQGQPYYMTYTVTDCNNVPIFSNEAFGRASALSTSPATASLTIPAFAFVGTATVHVNLFNADPAVPSQNALPYSPEATTTFTIGAVPSA